MKWTEWYLDRRPVSLRDMQTVFETVFETWATGEHRFIFDGSDCLQLIENSTTKICFMLVEFDAYIRVELEGRQDTHLVGRNNGSGSFFLTPYYDPSRGRGVNEVLPWAFFHTFIRVVLAFTDDLL
jgi:hypothetical protein